MKKLSDKRVLAIPNRPFSDKRVKIILGNIPPGGDYRKPLTKNELKLLRKAVPRLSFRVVDSLPELSDPRLELFLREYYHMGDSRINTLTWANIFDACKKYVETQQKKTEKELKLTEKPLHTNNKDATMIESEKCPDDLITLLVAENKYHISRITLLRAIKDGRLHSFRPDNCTKNHPHKVSESQVASCYPAKSC